VRRVIRDRFSRAHPPTRESVRVITGQLDAHLRFDHPDFAGVFGDQSEDEQVQLLDKWQENLRKELGTDLTVLTALTAEKGSLQLNVDMSIGSFARLHAVHSDDLEKRSIQMRLLRSSFPSKLGLPLSCLAPLEEQSDVWRLLSASMGTDGDALIVDPTRMLSLPTGLSTTMATMATRPMLNDAQPLSPLPGRTRAPSADTLSQPAQVPSMDAHGQSAQAVLSQTPVPVPLPVPLPVPAKFISHVEVCEWDSTRDWVHGMPVLVS